MADRWAGRVVVVTGGTAGVGRATARRFADGGARVAVLARDAERLAATERELRARGNQALAIAADVADADAVDAAADRIERELGPIDVWINNAMTSVFAEFRDVTPAEYHRVTDVVYHGTVHGTMSALRRMMPRDRGRIVFVGSALAYRGIPLQSAYCGAKHAVMGLFESLRAELLHRESGVTLSVVQLPAVNTPQFDWCRSKLPHRSQPVPPIFQPEVPARAIELAARTGRREVWVGSSTAIAIVGHKLAPALGDRYLARTGYRAQQTDEREDPRRPDNLFGPVAADVAAHGRFDARARAHSPLMWLSRHRGLVAAAVGATLVALAWSRRRS
ncbi:MAG TPA: SDR family oxidoreductase [Nannocystaceae bacterium]|nr:SDR family oxidoreductase [Nannocystaceae bacterium]